MGVLCYRPQFVTVRTKSLCQLLRLNRTVFLGIVQSNVADGTTIISNLLQYLKEHQDDPMMEGLQREIENMLIRGRLDLPVTLCCAILRGDDFLLHQLLRRGLDPNESDNNGHTALHIAASKGSLHCVSLLLDYNADPNSRDSEGSVPLWEAILGKREEVAKLLRDNEAELSAGDMGHFACTAAEQSDLDVLEAFVRYEGDVTAAKRDGTTALHRAVRDGNLAAVDFLLRHGGNVDAADDHGWTPRRLADQPGHDEIKALFESVRRFSSEPIMRRIAEIQSALRDRGREKAERMRRANFQNSLFEVFLAANRVGARRKNQGNLLSPLSGDPPRPVLPDGGRNANNRPSTPPPRVTISCPERGDTKKLVLLPSSMRELLDIGSKKFGFAACKVLTEDGAEIDDVRLIRDGERVVLAGEAQTARESSEHES